MRIGIPREIKVLEGRVGLVPEACGELIRAGHQVFLEQSAGEICGYGDTQYQRVGVEMLPDAAALYGEAELLLKVKEPESSELPLLRADHRLFCFLHLAANPELMRALLDIGLTAVAFETVSEGDDLPILAPMSDIAGRLSVQLAVPLLHHPQGGKGLLLGGLPAAKRGRVAVLGAGSAGANAARLAAALGAEVTVFDKRRERLAEMRQLGDNVTALYAYRESIEQVVRESDLLIGAVLVPGAMAPRLVNEELVANMEPGSVIVDISVDQGGCVATTMPRTYDDPTYQVHGVTHLTVTNLPGGVPRTAVQALSASLLPYVLQLARPDWEKFLPLQSGINLQNGEIRHPALQQLIY